MDLPIAPNWIFYVKVFATDLLNISRSDHNTEANIVKIKMLSYLLS